MVELDAVVTGVLPDSEADVSTRRRQKRVFKFGSIRVPGLKGFEELEGAWRSWWYYRDRKRTRSSIGGCVNHMPQAYDGVPVCIVVFLMLGALRADEGNGGRGGSRFVTNRASTSLCASGCKQ